MNGPSRRWPKGSIAVMGAALGLVLGCSTGPPKQVDDADTWEDPKPAPDPKPTPPPEIEDEEPTKVPMPEAPGASDDDTVPDVQDLSAADCRLLGEKFGDLTYADQSEKLPEGLKPEQRTQALDRIKEVADTLEKKWIDGCKQDLVGKTILADNFKCAVKAMSVEEFDGCLNKSADDGG